MRSSFSGTKASELILMLKAMIEKHGDMNVCCGGTDYPGDVDSISLEKKGNGYIPKNSFVIHNTY